MSADNPSGISVGKHSISMVLLTTFLTPLAILASFSINDRTKAYMMLFLFLEMGMLGVFMSVDLLVFFVTHPDRVFSREQLMELAKGSAEEAFDRSIDVHVSRLRQKLGDDPKRPRLIKTVRGAGYLLAGEGE